MTITALLAFMVLSQIALAGYLLYSFNDVEREARKRNADMRAFIESSLSDLERRLTGTSALCASAQRAKTRFSGRRSLEEALNRGAAGAVWFERPLHRYSRIWTYDRLCSHAVGGRAWVQCWRVRSPS